MNITKKYIIVFLLLIVVILTASNIFTNNQEVFIHNEYKIIEFDPEKNKHFYAAATGLTDEHLKNDLTGFSYQLASILGREDLISTLSKNYQSTECDASENNEDILNTIEAAAKKTSIVIISEAHEQSRHRAYITAIAERIAPLGYNYYAAEAFDNNTNTKTVLKTSSFPRDDFGLYTKEIMFSRQLRRLRELNYEFIAYESIHDSDDQSLDIIDRLNVREENQANNLIMSIFKEKPDAKVLIHVGFSHVLETPITISPDDNRKVSWLAARIKEATGVDPLTISQTICRGGGKSTRLAKSPGTEAGNAVDFLIDHPLTEFIENRPSWRLDIGDKPIDIPESLFPTKGWGVIEARAIDEPITASPIDRIAVQASDVGKIKLLLPPGRYKLQSIHIPD